MRPNSAGATVISPNLLKSLETNKDGHFRQMENLYTFGPIERTEWRAMLEQPIAIAYKPLHDLLSKTVVLASWLIVGTAVAAWAVSALYKRELAALDRIARETFLNEKILLNV